MSLEIEEVEEQINSSRSTYNAKLGSMNAIDIEKTETATELMMRGSTAPRETAEPLLSHTEIMTVWIVRGMDESAGGKPKPKEKQKKNPKLKPKTNPNRNRNQN
jgi:hypothetical protein